MRSGCHDGKSNSRAGSKARASRANSRRSIGDAQRTGYVEELHSRERVSSRASWERPTRPDALRVAPRDRLGRRLGFWPRALRLGRALPACVGAATLRAVSKESLACAPEQGGRTL